MTIHHDKFAYGKLKSCDEQLSQDELTRLIRQMNASADEEQAENPAPVPEAPAEAAAGAEPLDSKDPADK